MAAEGAADITDLGGGVVLTLIVTLVVGFLLVQRLWLTALATVLATLTGGWVIELVKHGAARARPELVPHLVSPTATAFRVGTRRRVPSAI